MNANRHNLHRTTRGDAARPSRRLRYRNLAFGVGLALGSLLVCGVAAAASPVAAIESPTGGKVVGGTGTISQRGAETVIQQQSNLLALDWQTFNVGKDASVLFNQPGTAAIALNRILDQNPSQIFGKISSNGQIFLINTHGIIFGASAQLNVGGLVASTLDLTPDDFLKRHFDLDAHGGRAGIVNHGTIAAASGGSVSLIGGQVENDGLIVADYGHINLDGADKAVLDFDGNGLINVEITGALKQRFDADKAAVTNSGALSARSGTVVLQASAAKNLFTDLVNNTGVIKAGGISTAGGVVRLVAHGGNTIDSGTIDASGTTGGSVQLLSDQNVGVMGGSIDASGTYGGGSIRVGGGWQGGEGLPTAQVSYVAPDASLRADALQRGDGGSVVVWGNAGNNFFGSISARGGSLGGDGGEVETSAHNGLNVHGNVDASAPAGQAGTWLLDPYDVTIQTGGTAFSNPFTASATSTIDPANIDSALTGGAKVFVYTNAQGTGGDNGDITVNSSITAAGKGSLYLKAAGSIFLNADISAQGAGSPLNVFLWGNYSGTATGTTYASNATCTSTTSCQVVVGDTADATIATQGGNLDVQTTGAVSLGNGTHTGTVNAGAGSVNFVADSVSEPRGTIAAASLTGNVTGDVTLSGANQIASIGNFSAKDFTFTNAAALSVDGLLLATGGTPSAHDGDISLTTTGSGNGLTVGTGGTVRGLNLTLDSAGDLGFDGNADAGGTLTLISGGAISQGSGSVLSAGFLNGNSAGATTLDNANQISELDNFNADGFSLTSAIGAFNVAGVVDGNAGGTSLRSSSGNLSITGTVGNTTGDTTLQALGAIEASSGMILADTLGGSAGGSATLTDAANQINALGDFTADGFSLVDSNALTVLASKTVSGGSSGTSLTTTAGDLVINGSVGDTGGDTTLTAAGGITEAAAGAVKASTLTGSAGADVTLTGANQVATLGAFSAPNFSLTNAAALAVAGPLTIGGGGGDISLATTGSGHALTVNAALTGGNIALTGAGGVTLAGNIDAGGTLQLTSTNAAIQQGGGTSITAGGITTINAGSGAVTLANAGNDFQGALNLAGGATQVTDQNALTLGTLATGPLTVTSTGALNLGAGTVTGTLDATSNGGAITQTGGLTVTGTSSIDAGANTITLSHAGNDFAGAVSLGNSGANDVTLDNGGHALTLGNVDVGTGTLALGGNGISQANGTSVKQAAGAGAVALDAGSGTVALTNSGNDFTGAVTAIGAGVAVTDVNDLAIAALTDNANGDVSLIAGGQLSGAGAINAGTGDITLAANGGALTTSDLTGHDISVTGRDGVTLGGDVDAGGTLQLTSTNAAIQQGSGTSITAGGITTIDAGSGAVTLANAGNDFQGALNLAGGATQVTDQNALTLGTLATGPLTVTSTGALNLGAGTVTGTLDATSNGGAITQTGGLTVTGTSSIDAGANTITLDHNGNDFAGAVSLGNSGANDVVLGNGSHPLSLGNVNVGSGSLTVDAAGITQVAGTGIVQSPGAGAASFNAHAGVLNLNSPLNDLTGVVSLANTGNYLVYLDNGSNALTLGALNVGSGPLTIIDYGVGPLLLTQDVTTDGGAVTFGGAVTIDGAPTLTIDTTGGSAAGANISFGGDVNAASANADSLTLHAGSGAVSFGGAVGNTAQLQNLTTTSKTFSLANTLNVGQDLSIATTAGPISQSAAWTVGGASSLDAGSNAITLTNASNSFGGQITVTGGAVELAGTGVLDMGSVSATSLILDGASSLHDDITTSGAQTYNGAVTLDASGNSVALSGNGITFAGTVDNASSAAPQDLTVNAGTGAAKFGSAVGSINGPLGALKVTGTGQAQFLGNVAAASLDATAPVLLGADISTSGDQDYHGAVALGGNVDVAANNGNVTFAGTLDNAVNGTPESLSVTAANGKVTFGNAVGSINGVLGDLTSNSATFSDSGTFAIGGDLNITTTAGGISQGAAWKVTGNSVFDAGNHAVSLTNASNDFTGSVTLAGAGVAVTDVNDLTIGGLTDNNQGDVSLIAGGQLYGVGPINAGAGSITLTAQGAVLTTAALTGGDIALTGGNGISIGDDVNAGGTLTLRSGGNIDEGASAVITANALTGSSTGSTHLDGNNLIANLGNFTANGFSLTNAQALAVASGITIDGQAGGTALKTTSGDLTINGTVGNAAGNTSLISAGNINEGAGGVVRAATLTGSSAGDTTLTGSNNKIASVGQFNAVNFTLVDNAALSVVGPLVTTGNISLTTTGSAANVLNVGQALTGGSVTLDSAGDLSITQTVQGSAVDLTANGNLSVDAAVDSGAGTTTLTQNGAGSISEGSGGSITAGTLAGIAQGAVNLTGTNQVASLGNFTAVNGFSLTNGIALTVAAGATLDGGASTTLTTTGSGSDLTIDGTVKGTTTRLVSSGAIAQGAQGAILADVLTGSAANAAQLTGDNAIDKLGNFSANGLALANGQTLTVEAGATVDGGASTSLAATGGNSNLVIDGTVKGTTTTLAATGAISQGAQGALVAGTLTGHSSGSTDLSGNNAVANLGDFTAAGFALTSNQSLNVASGATVDGGASTSLTTTGAGHDLGIDGTVKGQQVTLVSAGAIGEGSGGMLQGGTLSGSSVGDTNLARAAIGALGAFSAANFSLTNAGALTVNGPLSTTGNAGDISLATTGSGNALTVNQAVQGATITLASAGDLTVANAVTGTAVNLAADGNLAINAAVDSGSGTTTLTQAGTGAITGDANGSITAGTLTGSATGTTTLGSAGQFMANHVDTLGGFSSQAGFSFTNDGTLTLASVGGSAFTVDAGKSDLYLEVRNGDLLQIGSNWLYDGSGTWAAPDGHIGLQTAPIYVTGVGAQMISVIGMPPAYFYAIDANGNLLPLTSPNGNPTGINVPGAILQSKSQGVNGHTDHYIDIGVVTAIYRPYGIVPTGLLLPRDQYDCQPDQPPSELCPEKN